MPADSRKTLLCRYRYDPLDRLTDCAPTAEAGTQRFYCKSRLATEIQGAVQRSVIQHDDQLLAQLRREHLKVDATLLATDQQRSVLTALDATQAHPLAYTPYGHRPTENGLLSLLGFNGERPDPVTGHYLLGNGYRAFNPVLMRFNSPDSWSPFGEGGLSAYAYCLGNPPNYQDPTGHFSLSTISHSFFNFIDNYMMVHIGGVRIKPITNARKVATNVDIFEDIYKQKTRLNIVAHGGLPIDGNKPFILWDRELISPPVLHERLVIEHGVNFDVYDSIRLLVCHSADTDHSFAVTFATLTNKPVKAFSGPVSTGLLPEFRKQVPVGARDPEAKKMQIFKNRGLFGRMLRPYHPRTLHPNQSSIRRP
ncbi:RHS repeat-associated core domain-containing protein [Pseudomonas sp. SMV71]|uniref:RHS repeat-associated core domain-containing protein n=1 Tax=Pseudomonas sp. SMV71 TaxID=3390195 RepID=UPI003F8678AD